MVNQDKGGTPILRRVFIFFEAPPGLSVGDFYTPWGTTSVPLVNLSLVARVYSLRYTGLRLTAAYLRLTAAACLRLTARVHTVQTYVC